MPASSSRKWKDQDIRSSKGQVSTVITRHLSTRKANYIKHWRVSLSLGMDVSQEETPGINQSNSRTNHSLRGLRGKISSHIQTVSHKCMALPCIQQWPKEKQWAKVFFLPIIHTLEQCQRARYFMVKLILLRKLYTLCKQHKYISLYLFI